MSLARIVPPCLNFQWHGKNPLLLALLMSNLNRRIHVPLESVHGRPNMLFDFKELVDANLRLSAILIFHDRVTLAKQLVRSVRIGHMGSTYRRSGKQKRFAPGLQRRHFAHQILCCFLHAHVNPIQTLHVLPKHAINCLIQCVQIPSILLNRVLEYFMENMSIDLGLCGFTGGLDTILEDRATRAGKRIRDNRSGNKVVWMENDQVIVFIDDALAVTVEIAYKVDIGVLRAGAVEPGVSKGDGAVTVGLFFLDKQNL